MKYFNIRIVMVMLSLFMVSPTYADILQKIKIGDLYYNLNEDTKEASVTCQNKTIFDPWTPNVYYELTSVTIPKNVTYKNKTYKVTAIDEYAFCGEGKLTSIVIPKTVKSIQNYAFWGCTNLSSITLPEGLTVITSSAFNGCQSLTEIIIPEGVTTICTSAFQECTKLASITLPSTLQFIETSAFSYCPALKSIKINATKPFNLYRGTFEQYGNLYVPAGCKEAYENAAYWKKFNIIDSSVTGISNISSPDAKQPSTIFTLGGTRVSSLQKGVNIVNGKKVVVK